MTSTSSTQQISRPKRGRKPKNSSPEQPESEILQIQEKATQDTINQETTTQETTTAVIGQPLPNAAMTSTSSTQQIPRPKRGRKSKNSSPEQPMGTESETLQIQETATQDTTTQDADAAMTSINSTQQIPRPKRGRRPKNSSPEQLAGTGSEILQIQEIATQDTTAQETTTEETTTAVIEQSLPDATSTSSTQQIPRPKRGRKPKNSSPEQLVGTESKILQIQETVTQDTTTQETTTTIIAQPPSGVAIASTSSTQQIPRPKRGRKSKNSSPEQPIGTESETLQIQETATQDITTQETVIQETTIAVIEQPSPDAVMASTSSAQQISQMPLPKRGRKPKETTAQITEEPANVASTSATTSQRGRKRKIVAGSSTTTNQVASNNPDEEISEGNPPKRGRINVSEQELAEPVEVSSTTTGATKIRGKRRKTITENDDGEQEAGLAKENKRSKKTKKPEEKRLFNARTKCTAAIRERIVRAEQQRLYMVSRTKVDDLREEFAVLGSTGNVYTVTIAHVPNCTCPDFNKGNLCKHIFFVYLKVLRLNRDSSFIYQKALLSTELRSIFANAAPDPTVSVLANQRVRDKYKTFTSGEPESNADENEKRRPIEGNCPICYELLEEKDHKNIVWCKEGCGNNLHKDCFEQWKRSKRGDKVTCVYCRINWVDPDSEIPINEEGYVNLGDIQGMITIRDTTSYYRKYRTWF